MTRHIFAIIGAVSVAWKVAVVTGGVGVLVLAGLVAWLLYLPLLKPWRGFRRPPGAQGRWGE